MSTGRKQALALVISAGDMSGNITGTAFSVLGMDNIGVHFDILSGTPSGAFEIWVSNYISPSNSNAVPSSTHWVQLPLTSSFVTIVSGQAAQTFVDLNGISMAWVQPRYTSSSGSGSLNAYISGKQI